MNHIIMIDEYAVEYLDSVPENIDEVVHHGHIIDEAAHGVVCNYNLFCFVIRNSNKSVVGMLTAYTAYSEIYVDDIWIDPKYRKIGLGRRLLEGLENHFKGRGYNNINLVTSQFQAPEFYKKCGFDIEFIRQNKYNHKLTKTFFIKYFDDELQNQGVLEK